MTITIKKTPSYLKGLAENRARISADIIRYRQLKCTISDEYEKTKELYGQLLTRLELLDLRLQSLVKDLDSCDRLIRRFDERLDPEGIAPIKAWKGKYGKRGNLNAAILRLLEDQYPLPVSTLELAWDLQLEFSLNFDFENEREAWIDNSISRKLRKFCDSGQVERLHNPVGGRKEVGCWRIVTHTKTIDSLRTLADGAGVQIQEWTPMDILPDGLAVDADINLPR